MAFGRTPEQQALADAQASIGVANKTIRELRMALNNRDSEIAALWSKLTK